MSLISNNLKYLRRINGLTQDQFARRIGTKRANVGAYEESRAIPPVDTLKIIANTFGITVDDFVKKDIRKLRETPDLTFGFEAKPIYHTESLERTYEKSTSSDIDPFDTPITELPNNRFFEESRPSRDDFETYTAPSVGDLMKKFLGDEPEKKPEYQPTERVSQSVTLKPSFERELYVAPTPKIDQTKPQALDNQSVNQNISLVQRSLFSEYIAQNTNIYFLKTLPTFTIPTLAAGDYRAFEAGEDFAFEGASLIGILIDNWQAINDGMNYVLVTKSQGIIYRRVYNQIKIKGTLLLSTDNNRFPSSEISFMDVIETWEIKAFVSHILPQPSTPYNKIGN